MSALSWSGGKDSALALREMDLRIAWIRMFGVRKVLAIVAMVATAVLVAPGAAGGDRAANRVSLAGRLSVRVPPGWHVLHGWLSDVIDPAPRLAMASFPAKLSRHTCECGFPNVIKFPSGGAFVFVWEYLNPSRRQLARTPGRPTSFSSGARQGVRMTCDGPSEGFDFKDAGRIFQVEVYLGPAAGPVLRARAAATLDSLRVAGVQRG